MRKLWPLVFLLAACGTQDPTGAGMEPLRLTSTTLPPAYLGEDYAATFSAEGGVRPYTFSLEGKLPQGLAFQGGRISGVPREKGQFPLTLTVEDGAKNSRVQRLTLTVSDPPPPRLTLVAPPAQVEGPFLLLGRVEVREALGFQLELPLKDLVPDLSSLRVASPVHLLDYDPEVGLLRLDVAFAKPLRDQEVFRLLLTPQKALTPRFSPRVVFFDKEGKPLAEALRRGKPFGELLKLAQNWDKEGKELKGDANGDGRVDAQDLEALAQDYFPKLTAPAVPGSPPPPGREEAPPPPQEEGSP
ncbi:putative Ig domain-containing protein [Thermus neutrinimicus]|uniref:putative Ig domain-containing protein n=1 Tax=Thermus neutrinimicus TaxID=2908149 RepID=UPI001FA9999C|nr:putative Ig domain-containing protein [Thermus neutrinimicus]